MLQVGHTKGYIQVLVQGPESMLGTSAMVKITSVGRWSVFGEVIEILAQNSTFPKKQANDYTQCSDTSETCCSNTSETCCANTSATCCSNNSETCDCELTTSCGETERANMSVLKGDQNTTGSVLQKRKNNHLEKTQNEIEPEVGGKQGTTGWVHEWAFVDKALLAGMLASLLVIITIFLHLVW